MASPTKSRAGLLIKTAVVMSEREMDHFVIEIRQSGCPESWIKPAKNLGL